MVDRKLLYRWCSIRVEDLENHPDLKLPFRLVKNSEEMGELMAKELAEDIKKANIEGRSYRAIIPCGPKCWYEPFAKYINENRISLQKFFIWMSA